MEMYDHFTTMFCLAVEYLPSIDTPSHNSNNMCRNNSKIIIIYLASVEVLR